MSSSLTEQVLPSDGTEGQTLARSSAVLFLAQVLGNAGYFAAVLLLARGLGPSGRGATAFFIVTSMVAARAAGLGVREATTVFAAQRPRLRPALLTNLLAANAVSGIVVGLAVCFGLALSSVRPTGIGTVELALLCVGIVTMTLVDGCYSFLLGCSRFRAQALVTGASSWLYAAALLALWADGGLTVRRAALAWTVAQTGRMVFLLRTCFRYAGVGQLDLQLLREAVSYGGRAWVGSLARFANFRIDQVLMGFIATEASLGIYAVAVNASEILLYLPEATAMALMPLAAQITADRRADRAMQTFRSLTAITALGVVVAAVVGAPLLPVIFGSSFAASKAPFLWLLPGAFGYVAIGVFSSTLVASAPGLSSVGPLVSLVVGLVLDIALIPQFGANGAAAAASAAFLVGGAASIVLFRGRTFFAWSELVMPKAGDLDLLRALVAFPFRGRRAV